MEIFNSRSEQYKLPYGAVTSGTEILFHVRPPRSLGATSVYLCAKFEQTDASSEIEMDWLDLDCGHDVYAARLDTAGYVGLIWYYFRIESAGRRLFVANGSETAEWVSSMQITVYDPSTETIDWLADGVVYQIFPDRYCRLEIPETPPRKWVHASWDDVPDYGSQMDPDTGKPLWNTDFFGGSLRGIRSKLDHLKDLGVTALYLNPIFEAASSHRYDTGCYERVDALLGSEADFKALCAEAKKRGIRILLDGVFNHTGSDSVYFNREGHYDAPGACQSQDSPYFPWYSFERYPDIYSAWWGIDTLPAVEEMEPSYLDYIIQNPDSIVRRWLRAGADGWRLDVADELPDEFIRLLRDAVRETKPDAAVIGEVWEDASNKISYSQRRRHLLGGHLDGVMNYPFRQAVISFLLGGPAADFQNQMEAIRENYPPAALLNSMNILGTHDTVRILNVLGAVPTPDRDAQAGYEMPEETYALAKRRLKLAALILFSFPGMPVIYYGDEAGVYGFGDPFNRKPFPWGREDEELTDWYRKLAVFRQALPPLRRGEIRYIPVCSDVLAFVRSLDGQEAAIAVNASAGRRVVSLPWRWSHAYGLIGPAPAQAGDQITFELPPYGGALVANWPLRT